jgi:hypothetical protein
MTRMTLYRKYTIAQLVELSAALRADPANQTPDRFYIYTKATRKKLDDIGWAIQWHQADEREQNETTNATNVDRF